MLLRRATPLAIALAALACSPTVPYGPTNNNPTKIDYAVFDPTGSPPDIPLPNDLALLPQAIATQPPAQAALLTSFAGRDCINLDATGKGNCGGDAKTACTVATQASDCAKVPPVGFPNDQEVPITIDFVTQSIDPTTGAAGGLQPQPTFYLLLQGKDLTLPENEQLIRLGLPPGTTRAQADAAAVQLETIRKNYLALFGAIDASGAFNHSEIATMGTFTVADTAKRTHVETDASAGRIPLPSDFLTGADGHLLPSLCVPTRPFGPLGAGLCTLDGFSTTAMVLSQTSTAIQASTVQGGVFLYKLTPAASTPIRRLLAV